MGARFPSEPRTSPRPQRAFLSSCCQILRQGAAAGRAESREGEGERRVRDGQRGPGRDAQIRPSLPLARRSPTRPDPETPPRRSALRGGEAFLAQELASPRSVLFSRSVFCGGRSVYSTLHSGPKRSGSASPVQLSPTQAGCLSSASLRLDSSLRSPHDRAPAPVKRAHTVHSLCAAQKI